MESHESSVIVRYVEAKERALLARIEELNARIVALEADRQQGSPGSIGDALSRGWTRVAAATKDTGGVDALRRRTGPA